MDNQWKVEQLNSDSVYTSDKLGLLYILTYSNQARQHAQPPPNNPKLNLLKSEPLLPLRSPSHRNSSIDSHHILYPTELSVTIDGSEDESEDDESGEHGANFAVHGHGPTEIIYTDNEQVNSESVEILQKVKQHQPIIHQVQKHQIANIRYNSMIHPHLKQLQK